LKKAKAEILVGSPIPPDFTVLWRQCKQMGFYPKIATIGKACLFPSAVEALGGDLPLGITTEVWWTPQHPYRSSLSGISCQQLAEAWRPRPRGSGPSLWAWITP
jgi:branched-chain amino acid transport system substrate-binding protein